MSNPLAGAGASPKGAEQAQAAIDEGRRIGAKTAARARLHRGGRRLLPGLRATARSGSARLAAPRPSRRWPRRYPGRRRGADLLRAVHRRHAVAGRPDLRAYLKAAAILEKQFAKYPDHPGVAHYLIHSYDAPPIAAKGLPAARRYAGIAPDAPHALHMPSHIFTRVGAWEDSAATNRARPMSREAGRRARRGLPRAATTWCTPTCSSRATPTRARAMDEARKLTARSARRASPRPYALGGDAGALRRRARRLAARRRQLEPRPSSFPFTEAHHATSRARSAPRAAAIAAAAQTGRRAARGAARGAEDGEERLLGDRGRGAAARRRGLDRARAEASATRRSSSCAQAADLEDRNEKHIVTPGRILPARELLGDMLLELKQPAAALKEYEASQLREPNRFRGYRGARARRPRPPATREGGGVLRQAAGARRRTPTAQRPELVQAKAPTSRAD